MLKHKRNCANSFVCAVVLCLLMFCLCYVGIAQEMSNRKKDCCANFQNPCEYWHWVHTCGTASHFCDEETSEYSSSKKNSSIYGKQALCRFCASRRHKIGGQCVCECSSVKGMCFCSRMVSAIRSWWWVWENVPRCRRKHWYACSLPVPTWPLQTETPIQRHLRRWVRGQQDSKPGETMHLHSSPIPNTEKDIRNWQQRTPDKAGDIEFSMLQYEAPSGSHQNKTRLNLSKWQSHQQQLGIFYQKIKESHNNTQSAGSYVGSITLCFRAHCPPATSTNEDGHRR